MIDLRKNKKLGTVLFYILWPLVWFYAPLRVRVRVIIRVKDEVLVVKNWFGPNFWQLPGGGMKNGETVADTASREIKEELGVCIKDKDIISISDDFLVVRSFGLLFRYRYALVNLKIKPKTTISSEITDEDWVKIELLKLPQKLPASL